MKKLVIFGSLVAAAIVAIIVLSEDADSTSPEGAAKNGADAQDASPGRETRTDSEAGETKQIASTERRKPYTEQELREALGRYAAAQKHREEGGTDPTDDAAADDFEEADDAIKDTTDKTNRPKLTVREEQVMVMYDEMADVLEEHAEDCKSMSNAVDELIESNERTITSWKRTQAELDEEGLATSRARVEGAAPERLARIRQNLRVGLAKCKGDASLMTALGKLAALNE